MSTVKAKLRSSSNAAGAGRVVYMINHQQEVGRIPSSIALRESEWDDKEGIAKKALGSDGRTIACANKRIAKDIAAIKGIIGDLEAAGREYEIKDVARAFLRDKATARFPDFMEKEIEIKGKSGRLGTAKTYACSLKRLRDFASSTDCSINVMTEDVVEEYEAWLKARGVCLNTSSFYMRTLRTVHGRMVKEGVVADSQPFSNVYTGIAKTRKRALTAPDIKRIKEEDLSHDRRETFVRDMFMLSFYMMGISYVDMAFLKKSDVSDGKLTYKRMKTGQEITVGINGKIRKQLNRYPSAKDSPFLLPIIRNPKGNTRSQYLSALCYANRKLKNIAKKAGVEAKVTTYTSRHTWASIVKQKNIELSIISDAMGHQSESTTRIYLATLDHSKIDRANNIILRGL